MIVTVTQKELMGNKAYQKRTTLDTRLNVWGGGGGGGHSKAKERARTFVTLTKSYSKRGLRRLC